MGDQAHIYPITFLVSSREEACLFSPQYNNLNQCSAIDPIKGVSSQMEKLIKNQIMHALCKDAKQVYLHLYIRAKDSKRDNASILLINISAEIQF